MNLWRYVTLFYYILSKKVHRHTRRLSTIYWRNQINLIQSWKSYIPWKSLFPKSFYNADHIHSRDYSEEYHHYSSPPASIISVIKSQSQYTGLFQIYKTEVADLSTACYLSTIKGSAIKCGCVAPLVKTLTEVISNIGLS